MNDKLNSMDNSQLTIHNSQLAKKGYKKTEIGVIPEDWEVSYFSDVAVLFTDHVANGSFSTLSSNLTILSIPDYALYVRLYDLRLGLRHTKQKYVDKRTYDFLKKSKLFGDEILIANIGANVGEAWLMPKFEGYATLAPNMVLVRINEQIHFRKYIYFYLKSEYGRQELSKSISGSGHPKLNKTDLKKILLALPPLPEQKAIAEVLSDTDKLIQTLEKKIAKKQLIKKGAMQMLLAPPTQMVNDELSMVNEKENSQFTTHNSQLKKEGWEVKTLGEIGVFKNGINKSIDDFGFGFPFVNLMDVFGITKISSNKHLELLNSNKMERELYNLKKGDVLFIRSSVKPSGVGLTSVITQDLPNTVFSGFIIRFRDKDFLTTEFKEYCFFSKHFRDQVISNSSVSANTNINQDALSKITIHFPRSKEEQTRIAQILSDMDAEIEALKKKLEKYKQIKQGLMQVLLTGKIRLSNN